MIVTFFCKKHEVHLSGYPLWVLISVDPETHKVKEPDVYEVSFDNMFCPVREALMDDYEVPIDEVECKNFWTSEVKSDTKES